MLDTWDNPARTQRNHHRRRHDRTVSSPWLVLCHSIPHTLASAGLREAEAEAGKRAEPGEAEVLKASCLVLSPHPPENVQFHTVSPPAPLAAVARRAFQRVRRDVCLRERMCVCLRGREGEREKERDLTIKT